MRVKPFALPLLVISIGLLLSFLNFNLLYPKYLTFSDAAKFADIARNVSLYGDLGASYAIFQNSFLEISGSFPLATPPLLPLLISFGFKLFGVSDQLVVIFSSFFYLGAALLLFILGKNIFNSITGFLTALVFLFDPSILNYASIGASESLFVFELVLATLLFYKNSTKTVIGGFLTLIAMYFTRPSAIIYIAGFILLFALFQSKSKTQVVKYLGFIGFLWLFLEMIIAKFSNSFLLYSPINTFLFGAGNFSSDVASTTALRGGIVSTSLQPLVLIKKIFYDLYNFYKLLPQIVSPYLAAFYFLSLVRWEKEEKMRVFRMVVLLMVLMTFFATAATLPIFRYIHPVIPFVYLLAVEMLVWTITSLFKDNKKVWLASLSLVIFFIGGQTLGKIFLDSRFLAERVNSQQPPVYTRLAWILKERTNKEDLIITNLDTWGTWYGERKTIWYPLEPKQLESGIENVDAIYLTSYKMDDGNYFMGDKWRQAFLNPEDINDPLLKDNFKLSGVFEVKPEETYEKEGAKAVLFIKK